MNLSKKAPHLLRVLLVPFLLYSMALAAEPGDPKRQDRFRLNLGGGAGSLILKNSQNVFPGATQNNRDTRDVGFKAFLGFELEPNSIVELTYYDLGEFRATAPPTSAYATWETQAAGIAYVAGAPINNYFSFHFRVGGFYWKTEVNDTSIAYTAIDRGASYSFGVGTQLDLGRWIALRLEWENFADVGNSRTTGKSDLQLFSGSLLIRL